MLPQPKYVPPRSSEFPKVLSITPAVAFYLFTPIGRKAVAPYWKSPAVPKIAVHKNSKSCAGKN